MNNFSNFAKLWDKFFSIIIIIFAFIYTILPADLVPDLVPILGWLDDIAIDLFGFVNVYLKWRKLK